MNTCPQSIHTRLGFIQWILRHTYLAFLFLFFPSVKFKMLWQISYGPHSKPVCQVSWWLDQYLMGYGQFLARSHLCKFSLVNTGHVFQQILIIYNINVYHHLLRLCQVWCEKSQNSKSRCHVTMFHFEQIRKMFQYGGLLQSKRLLCRAHWATPVCQVSSQSP